MIRVNVGVEVRIVLLLFPLVQASGRRTARQLGPCKSGTLKFPHDRVSVARGQTRKQRQPRTRHHPSKAVVLLPTRKLAPTCSSKDPPKVHFQAKSRSIRNLTFAPTSLQAARCPLFVLRPQDCPLQQKKKNIRESRPNCHTQAPQAEGAFNSVQQKQRNQFIKSAKAQRRHWQNQMQTKKVMNQKCRRSCTLSSSCIVTVSCLYWSAGGATQQKYL